MNEPIVIKFSETAPVWRRIGYGLNLEGQCANLKCEAYHQKVWIVKGFGNFNITKEGRKLFSMPDVSTKSNRNK